jgi:hypothetical protein
MEKFQDTETKAALDMWKKIGAGFVVLISALFLIACVAFVIILIGLVFLVLLTLI